MTSGELRHRRSNSRLKRALTVSTLQGCSLRNRTRNSPSTSFFYPHVPSFAKILMLSFRRVRLFVFAVNIWSLLRVS
jgi:hypothetical protein